MKRNVVRLLGLFLSVFLLGGVLASCNKEKQNPQESKSEATNESQESPYRIEYLNDSPYEGNCTAQLYLNPSYTKDFTVEIPANSPDGKLITHFNVWNNFFVGDCVPKIVSEKTFQEAIMKPLEEAVARGDLSDFYYRKFMAYFMRKNVSNMVGDKENCIKQYPITDPNGANVPIYVFASEASVVEIQTIQGLLDKYTSFSKETIKADYAYFQDAIRKSPLSETRKAELLSEYQYSEYEHFVGLTLPDTLWSVEALNLIGFKNLIQTENGISYIGNWVVHADNSLTSIVLRDGTVGIAYGGISIENLKSITIPASLKTICGSIVDEDFSGRSFRELHISNLAAWCAVRYVTGNYSGLRPFDRAYDLYLNGELLTDLVIPDGVTSIESSVISNCTSVTSVTIPNSVTSIGDSAFSGCTGLTSVTIPNSVTSIGWRAFSGCSGLTNITIPNSVTRIRENTFSGCSSLIQKEDGVWYVDKWVIGYDESAKTVVLRGNTVGISDSAFSGCIGLTSITIPDSVTSMGERAFFGCTGLTSITIPNGVTSIGDSAFSGCNGLVEIAVAEGNPTYQVVGNCLIETESKTLIAGCKNSVIPTDGRVTSIGSGAFKGRTGLTSITIPNSVTSIGNSAFSGCTGLTSVTIPNSVTSIGDYAFYDCIGLTSVTIPDSVTSIGDYAFHDCTGLTSITIGNGLASIGEQVFSGCKGLTSITIPDRVTSIGWRAFWKCTGLTNIIIPNSVTRIGSMAFEGCTGLTNITIPDSVTSIDSWAFYDCTNLTSITFLGTKEQWTAILKESGWTPNTGDYTVHCTDGDIAKS